MTAMVDAEARVDCPQRVDDVRLIGQSVGFGYRRPPSLVRRGDGQVLQLTPLLYAVLGAVDGTRTYDGVARLVGDRLHREISAADVRTLVERHLRPLGLVAAADGSVPQLRRSNPLLALKPKFAVTSPRITRRLTSPFGVLFNPVVVVAVVLGFFAIVGWVFFEHGLGASAYDAFDRPHLLVLVFGVSVLSAGFHEFGHAAAARYGGAQPGAMGAGLYLVWPAFYTDVTDSYRLGRAGRIRTDLGGLYFNAVVVVGTFAWWAWTGWEALLLLVATQVLQMVQQLQPLLRFDGYHLLADLAGVPDLYHRIRPTLVGLLPHRWRSPANKELKPGARAVIVLWVLVTVPLMALMLLAAVGAVPRLLATAGHVLGADTDQVALAWRRDDLLDVAAHSLEILGVVVPTAGCILILSRVGARYFSGLARWSRGSAPRRLVAVLLGTALVTVLFWAWWPRPGSYVPITPDEGIPLVQTVHQHPVAVIQTLGREAPTTTPLAEDRPLVVPFEDDGDLPTKEHPALTMVLLPSEEQGGSGGEWGDAGPDGNGTTGQEPVPWVFPFDQPLPPEEGDNQALAVNTTDGTVTYDVAFALVWADGDEVLNVNEAHAYASCTDCVAVAVAFQVVVVMEDAHVVVPQNLAVAANYDCVRCLTAAIADQLVVSVGSTPGDEQLHSLAAVWDELLGFAHAITQYSIAEITAQLDEFEEQIAAILEPVSASPSPVPTASPATETPSPTAVDPSVSATTAEPPSTTTSEPSPTAEATPTPTPSPTEPVSSSTPSTSTSSAPASPTPTVSTSP